MTLIAPIVEGHGEETAVPELIRRIAYEIGVFDVKVAKAIRVHRGERDNRSEGERGVRRGACKEGAVLVLLDADGDCPAQLGPRLQLRAEAAAAGVAVSVVVAKEEFEAWFIAAAQSLRGQRGLAPNLLPPQDPEAIVGAKEWLTARRVDGQAYKETLDQVALAAVVDLGAARSAESFDKFYREVVRLLG